MKLSNNMVASPRDVTFNASKSIPIIDLEGIVISQDRDSTIQKILKAGQDCGFLQVHNFKYYKHLLFTRSRLYELELFAKIA